MLIYLRDVTLSRVQAWFPSLNAKLFIVMAALTSVFTVAVAFLIISGFRQSTESYTKDLALSMARGVVEDIHRQDPELRFRRETAVMLASWVHPESVHQIDIFTATEMDSLPYVELWATSEVGLDKVRKNDREILKMMALADESAELVRLDSGQTVWRVYIPIQNSGYGKNTKILLRAYCNLDRWDALWKDAFRLALKTLPIVIALEFALLWALTFAFVRRPMSKLLMAMKSLGKGDASVRADLSGRDELSQIAHHFDAMADELQTVSRERERLLKEVQGFNETLQDRIDVAMSELKSKNEELELLLQRVSLLREELSQQERMAIAGQLSAAFAHEVGTPLNLVNGHLQLLMGEMGLDSLTKERLGIIHAQIERVAEIVKKLLSHTRPLDPKPESVSLLPLSEELRRLWSPTLTSRGVGLRINIPDDCILHVDRKQIEQLLINLVNNALDAMSEGGNIALEAFNTSHDTWELVLSDTGTGIPEENITKVFKPMFTTKAEGRGTGLGLAICRGIVRAHGGEIRIESCVGEGTTIRFTLPATSAHHIF